MAPMTSVAVLLSCGVATAFQAGSPRGAIVRSPSATMAFSFFTPQKSRLLEIDDCLMDAIDPAMADECIVAPPAESELTGDASFNLFYPIVAIGFAAILAIAAMPVNPDQAVGELGTPQITMYDHNFDGWMDNTPIPGPPPPGF